MKIRTLALAALIAACPLSAALADECADEIAAIDKALAGDQVPQDSRPQIEDMKKQAADLCAAGNTQEGLDVLSEALAMINEQ